MPHETQPRDAGHCPSRPAGLPSTEYSAGDFDRTAEILCYSTESLRSTAQDLAAVG